MKLAILRGTHRNANNNPFQMSRRESLILPFTLWDCVNPKDYHSCVLAQDVERWEVDAMSQNDFILNIQVVVCNNNV